MWIFRWYALKWLYENPIMIPIIILYFIPYFFIISLMDYVVSWNIPGISPSVIIITGLLVYTFITVFVIVKVAIMADDKKK